MNVKIQQSIGSCDFLTADKHSYHSPIDQCFQLTKFNVPLHRPNMEGTLHSPQEIIVQLVKQFKA